jgi:short-subunit dehydrogenase
MEATALITGGGTGIGRGVTLALARRGAAVAVVGRRPAPLAAVCREAESLGARAFAFPADLARPEERERLAAQVRAAVGPVHLLVNNAGLLTAGELAAQTADDLERAVAVNLTAPLDLTRRFAAETCRLAATPNASRDSAAAVPPTVVFVASTAGLVPWPYLGAYSGPKAGLRFWAEALRHELEPRGVRVLVAYPPLTATAMLAGRLPEPTRWLRLARPETVGEQIVTAALAGKREWFGSAADRWLSRAYRFAPGLMRWLLRGQRRRFAALADKGGACGSS